MIRSGEGYFRVRTLSVYSKLNKLKALEFHASCTNLSTVEKRKEGLSKYIV
jgi:hypothetical protein